MRVRVRFRAQGGPWPRLEARSTRSVGHREAANGGAGRLVGYGGVEGRRIWEPRSEGGSRAPLSSFLAMVKSGAQASPQRARCDLSGIEDGGLI